MIPITGTIASLLLVCFLSVALYYTQNYIDYLEAHPIFHPETPSNYQPDGGALGCRILNHTYFDSDGRQLIDIYATVENKIFSNCLQNKTICFYSDIFASFPGHNASRVNKTIDQEFPIGEIISCCINRECTLFNNDCTPDHHPSYTEPQPSLSDYKSLYQIEVFFIICSCISLVAFLAYIIIEKFRKKGYEALNK